LDCRHISRNHDRFIVARNRPHDAPEDDEAYVVRVDNATGVPDIVTAMDDKK